MQAGADAQHRLFSVVVVDVVILYYNLYLFI